MKNKVYIRTFLLVFILSWFTGSINAQEPTPKGKAIGLSIRPNSRDNQPKRRDNLHRRILVQKNPIIRPVHQLNKEPKVIRPNKNAVKQRQMMFKKGHRASVKNRINR